MSTGKTLLTPALLARIERLRLQARETPSLRSGARRTRQVGTSVEFAEYRSYLPGDDLRHLDWRAYARLGKLFLKTFIDERDALLYLLIDTSQSMAYGDKLLKAKQLAAALGYLALSGDDRVEAWMFAERLLVRTPRLTGKPSSYRLFEMIEQTGAVKEGDGEARAEGTLHWLLRGGMPREPGVVVLLSDFLFSDSYEEALRRLQAARHQVVVVQILAREEFDPTFIGDRHLIDSESGIGRDVAISPHVIERYKRTVEQYIGGLREFCRRRGMNYALVGADESLDDVIFCRMFETGVVRT